MFTPGLYRPDDPELSAARARADEVLTAGVRGVMPGGSSDGAGDEEAAGLAAWSIVHGFAHLWLSGALPADLGDDPVAAAGPVIRMLFER